MAEAKFQYQKIYFTIHCGPPPFLVTKTLHKGGTKSYASLRQLLLPRTISKRVREEAILVKSSIKI